MEFFIDNYLVTVTRSNHENEFNVTSESPDGGFACGTLCIDMFDEEWRNMLPDDENSEEFFFVLANLFLRSFDE